jgi:SPP1 gp7 family putative phage head morphogenesis protein
MMAELVLSPITLEAAAEFWRSKVQLSPGQFNRLADEVKTLAFGIGGIAKGAELATVFEALQRAMEDGISFGDFKAQCAAIFERRGWTGLSSWRVDNIFRTNIQTAYNVGRYRELQEMADSFPYWEYDAVNDRRTRPTHRALDGKVFPANHQFWDTWYPPNGFRCRCSVMALTEGEVAERGLKVETEDPTGRLIEPLDPVTGNRVPARPLIPDPGFAHHPGKTVWGGVVDSAGGGGLYEPLPSLHTPADYGRRALANVQPAKLAAVDEGMLLPAGQGDDFYRAEFLRRYGEEKLIRDAAGEPVVLSLRSFLVDKTPGAAPVYKFGKAGHGEMVPLLEAMLVEPYEIWLTPQKNAAGKARLARRYISLWKTADKERIGGLAVFEVIDGVWSGVTAFVPFKGGLPDLGYVERQRLGLLLYGR